MTFNALLPFYVCCFANVFSQSTRAVIAVIAPELLTDLALDNTALANLQAVIFLAFAAAQIPIGVALDRLGPRRVMGVMIGAAAAGLVLLAATDAYPLAIVGGLLIGLGTAPVQMGGFVMLVRLYPPQTFAFRSAMVMGIGQVGTLVAAGPFAWIAAALGWRGAMLVTAAAGLVAALAVLGLGRDAPQGQVAPKAKETLAASIAGVGQVLRIRVLWWLVPFGLFGYASVITLRGLWAGPYLHEVHGLDLVGRGNALLVMSTAIVIGCIGYGMLEKRLGHAKWLGVAGTVATVASLAGLAIAPDAGLIPTLVLLSAIGLTGMTYVPFFAHLRPFLPDALIGRGVTTFNGLIIAGAWAMQAASGPLMDWTAADGFADAQRYAILFGAIAVLLVLGTLVYLRSPARPKLG